MKAIELHRLVASYDLCRLRCTSLVVCARVECLNRWQLSTTFRAGGSDLTYLPNAVLSYVKDFVMNSEDAVTTDAQTTGREAAPLSDSIKITRQGKIRHWVKHGLTFFEVRSTISLSSVEKNRPLKRVHNRRAFILSPEQSRQATDAANRRSRRCRPIYHPSVDFCRGDHQARILESVGRLLGPADGVASI